MGSVIPKGVTILHPTKDFDVIPEFKDGKIIVNITYSDGTKVRQTFENNTIFVEVLNRQIELLPDGKTARVVNTYN